MNHIAEVDRVVPTRYVVVKVFETPRGAFRQKPVTTDVEVFWRGAIRKSGD
ncbi:hypothetical protein IMZ48_39230 [Candidatus Bathyarchaeota archaeon]|nr:hypothetical protein [Candidatus Bathyarchaeota archaeon]